MSTPAPRFTEADIDHYHAHGYVLLRNFLDDDELNRVYVELERVIPESSETAASEQTAEQLP